MELKALNLAHLTHWLNLIGRRIVPYVCSSHDFDKFAKWQMNCCRQTAMVVHGFLESVMCVKYGITDIQTFETSFHCPVFGKFEHSWTSCTTELFDSQELLIDVGTIIFTPLTVLSPVGHIVNIRSEEAGWNIKHVKTVELDYQKLNEDTEYYTGLLGKDFVGLSLSYLHSYL